MGNIFKDNEVSSADPHQSATTGGPFQSWVNLSRQAYQSSTDYWNSSLYKQWQRNIAMFRSRHPEGSKYRSENFRHRSKLFRPKTRAGIRRNEAAATMAFFQTEDVVSITPEDDSDVMNVFSAQLRHEVLNYRMNTGGKRGMKWFLTVIGGCQDAMVMGAVCSCQEWSYLEEKTVRYEPEIDPYTGQTIIDAGTGRPWIREIRRSRVVEDKPKVRLVPLENIRLDPGADWTDPVNSSPYFIELMPMYVCDVKARMQQRDPKTGEPVWLPLSDQAIVASRRERYDSVRQEREGRERRDSKQQEARLEQYDIVWVHKNFARRDGRDWVFYTMGTSELLSYPKPVEEVYPQGRPYVLGYCVIEAHRFPPSGLVELGEGIQATANEIANQRIDNIRQVLNKRYFVKRTGQVDMRALRRNVAGGIVPMNDPNNDVKESETQDVTSSSYQEQDRLNLDFDEVFGSFSPGSIQSNRRMNETVGGLNLLAQDSNTITEYQLRVLAETWIEPVIRQVDILEQHYESDEVLLRILGPKTKIWKRVQKETGLSEITPDILKYPVEVRVNVGFGAINPEKRIERMVLGFGALANIAPAKLARVNGDKLADEIFGILGYQDSSQFFFEDEVDDPQTAALMEQLEQLQKMVESEAFKEKIRAKSQGEVEQIKGAIQKEIEKLKGEILLRKEYMRIQGELEKVDRQGEQSHDEAMLQSRTQFSTARMSADSKRESAKSAGK